MFKSRKTHPKTPGSLSRRDQDLLKLSRLLAENKPPKKPAAAREPEADKADGAPGQEPGRPAGWFTGPLGQALQVSIILLVVVWVFLLGVLVGRNRPEESSHRLVGWLEKMAGWAQSPPVVLSPADEIPPPAAPRAAAARPAPPPAAPDRPEFDEPEEWTPLPDDHPEDDPEGEAEAPAAPPEKLFSVQASLAGDEKEARDRVARLEDQGFTAYFYQSGRRFPVRVGPFSDRAEAEEMRLRLQALGYKGPYISELRP
ncbi:MAG: SPOR domain-containing protein [Candidatus Adiutrix sp.]|jgi:cell division septation protein DedD|nr:SPOR domain-containing protein [Candidatus Adiutrix sp.]